jgi:MFS family permease
MHTDRKNLTWCTLDGILATPWTLLMLPASFLMSSLLMVYYGISPQVFGAIVSIPFWCNALQIAAVPVVARFMTVRELTLSMAWLNVGLCAMLSLLTFVLPADGWQRLGGFFAGFFLLAAGSQSLMVLGWQSWVKDIVPERIRGTFFGRRNRWASISSLLFLFLSMALLGWSGNGLWAFQVLITLAVVLRGVSVLVQHLIHRPPGRVWNETISTAWFEDIRDLFRNRTFLRFVLFGALFGFWNGAAGAYIPVYLLGYLEFGPSQFAACTIIATVTGGLSLPTWGRLCDRFGSVRVAAGGLLVWRTWDFLWVVVTPEINWLLYIMWAVGGLVASGFLLAGFNVLLEVTPRNRSVAGMSLNLCVTSVAAASAPLLAGLWVGWATSRGWSDPAVYRPLLALAFAGCLASVPVLLKLPPRRGEAPPARHAIGAMRTARQQLVSAGLAFLGNVSLAARPWRRSGKRRRRVEKEG